MPFISEDIPLPRNLDRRVKLSDKDKAEIRRLYYDEKLPIRGIARMFEKICSRRMIQFVLFPERNKRVAEQGKAAKRWKKYSSKEYRTPVQRKTRNYKQRLYKAGLLSRGQK